MIRPSYGREGDHSRMQYVSFFSGALGLDYGLERAGWRCLMANEFDPVACQTIRTNRPRLPLAECDIRQLSLEFLRRKYLGLKEVDCVVGGPPCQAFSTAGRRQGLNDDRGHVFLHFLDLAIELDPQYILIENVRGLLSAPLSHRPHNERGQGYPDLKDSEKSGGALRLILSLLEEAGYAVSFRLYDTSKFGVPQVRERLVMIARKGSNLVPHLNPTGTEVVTVRESLAGLDVCHETTPLRAKAIPYLDKIGPGENWRSLPPDLQKEALGNVYHCTGGRTGFLRRVAWDKPAPTLVTSPSMPATLLAHPEELRALSVQEYARLQTFPDSWVFCGKTIQKYKQIGNAVPCKFGEIIGRHISQFDAGLIEKTAVKNTSRYRSTDETEWRKVVVL